MKKILLCSVILMSLSSSVFAASNPPSNVESEIKQKSCQNVFSFINIDLSLMSPRATVSDTKIDASTQAPVPPKKDKVVPVSNKQKAKNSCTISADVSKEKPAQSRTSLFRIDLLHIFKLQIL